MNLSVSKDNLLAKLRGGAAMTGREQLKLTFLLAIPAILAQLAMCLMTYIDAAMLGRLGSGPAASVGLVSSTTWLFGSFCYGASSGFSVQIAHRCGASDSDGASRIFRQGLLMTLSFSALLAIAGASISGALPRWLGGDADIIHDASAYFLIYALFLPVLQLAIFSEASLIASGNMKVPSLTSFAMCLLDVLFNYIFIFVLDMGAKGAALGTGLAELSSGAFLLAYARTKSSELNRSVKGTLMESKTTFQAWHITWPLWLQNIVTRGAYIAATVLIAPLGTIAIAANSFAIIAEGFCYLPGYGMQDAASTLVGQSLGAGRKDLAKRFSWMTIGSGAALMGILAVFMFAFAGPIMGLLTPDAEVIALGAKCLRIEAWAEVLFGVSIVAYGCCIGAGDTLVPSGINLMSMWVVRILVAVLLIPRFGLEGYWYAMALELSVKGVIFAVRIARGRWMKTKLTTDENN